MSTMLANCTINGEDKFIQPDPDISGIGIRTSVYVTTLLLALLPRIPETEDIRSALSSATGLQATALTITALIKTSKEGLSLYHALIIFHLLLFLCLTVDYLGPIRGTMLKVGLHLTGAWITMVLYLAWSLVLWTSAPSFGHNKDWICNDKIKYVVFFKEVDATADWLRWLFVTGASLGFFFVIFIPLVTLLVWLLTYKRLHSGSPSPSHSASASTDDSSTHDGRGSSEDALSDRTASLRFLAAIYGVVMLELTVRQNKPLIKAEDGTSEADWGFGQIAAVVILLSTVNELLHALISLLTYHGDKGDRRKAFGRALKRVVPFSTYGIRGILKLLSLKRRNRVDNMEIAIP